MTVFRRVLVGIAIVIGALALAASLSAYFAVREAVAVPDVAGVREVTVGYGTLTVVQDGTDRLEVKASPGVAAQVMTRRTGTLLELGLADDADPRQFLPWFFPPALPGSSLEFVLHTKSATRFAADDRGNVRIDGFKADELKLRMMYVATVVASNIDVGALDVSFDGGATGSMALAGRAKSESVFRSDATATLDESKLVVGP